MNAENVHQDIDLAAPDLPREPEDVAGPAAPGSGAETAFDTEAGALIGPEAEFEPAESESEPAEPEFERAPEPATPPTGTMSAERLAAKALEARLLGGERKLRRRERLF